MIFFSDILTHFWAIASIAITYYCFVTVRRPKFIVITKKEENILINDRNLNFKLNDIPIKSNIYYEQIIICYLGSNDTKVQDTDVPLTIYGSDENTKFYNVDIINTSSSFKPKYEVKDNAIQITSPIIKNGDAFELSYFGLSKSPLFHISQRYFNVDLKIKFFKDDKRKLKDFFLWLLCIVGCAVCMYVVKFNFDNRHIFKDDFKINYNFQGYRVSEKSQWKSDIKVDSLFVDAYKRRNNFQERPTLTSKKRLTPEEAIEELKYIFDFEDKNKKIIDSLNKITPSVLALEKYHKLKKDDKLKFDEEFDINNDLKIIISNPKEDSFSDLLKYGLITTFLLLFTIIPIVGATKRGIELYYFYVLKKYIKV